MTGWWRLKLMTYVNWRPWIKSSKPNKFYFKPNKSLWWKLPYPNASGLENHVQGKANFLPQFPPEPAAGVPWSARYTFPDPECSLSPSEEVPLSPWLSSPASSALGFLWTQIQKGPLVLKTGRRGVSFLERKRELVSSSGCKTRPLQYFQLKRTHSLRTKGLAIVNHQEIWSSSQF